jgi:ubiquinone biosynthesis protein
MHPSRQTAMKTQPVHWVLTEAAHPVASQYHRLVHDMPETTPRISLLRIRDCTDLLLRYACVIQLAHRYETLGENGAWEKQVLENAHHPDGPKRWFLLLENLTESARDNGWEETLPIHHWLFEQKDGKSVQDLLRSFCLGQEGFLPERVRGTGAARLSGHTIDAALEEQFSSLNQLLEHASFLKTWPLLQRFQGTTKAWMGMAPPRNSRIRTPRRLEGHFILYWGRKKFLSLSPYISLLARPFSEERLTGGGPRDSFRRFHVWIQTPGQWARRWMDRAISPSSTVRIKALEWSADTFSLLESTAPLRRLFHTHTPVTPEEFTGALDTFYQAMKAHRITPAVSELGDLLRVKNILPNEQSTEHLIRFLVDQVRKRSPVPIPELFVSQFWTFFSELERDPDTKGLMEINYDILRNLLRIYEPILLEGINLWKETRQLHDVKKEAFAEILNRISKDFQIFRRQVLALRHIKSFLQAEPRDFSLQAKIVARMVGEFGPFFIKFAQVAATHTDFLPREIAVELEQFQEEVPPMPADQMLRALQDGFGQAPTDRYYGLDPARPIQSGSIASVYLAKKPVMHRGRETLFPVVLKVAREDLAREFLIGEKVLELAILSTHYWAPHSKISPFLQAWMDQVRQWSRGFQKELDFQNEASVQKTFNRLGSGSRIWSAPKIFEATDRVLEMEYVQDAESMKKIVQGLAASPFYHKRKRNRIARNLLFTVLLQAVQHRKIHGDLHPGNILVDRSGKLHLIDWGNSIELREKILPLLRYVQGVLMADVNRIAEALVTISSDPSTHRKNMAGIRSTLGKTLRKKGVTPLRRKPLKTWLKDPGREVQRRLEAVPHILSNTQTLGIAIESDYLQMSRSISALLGTYLSLFPSGKKLQGLLVLIRVLAEFPYVLTRERFSFRRMSIRRRIFRSQETP